MDYKYIYDDFEGIRLGNKIKRIRQGKGYLLMKLASDLSKKRVFDYSMQTIERRLTNLENGNLYFGATTTAAIRKRGGENLALLSKYLAFLGVSEKDELINELKKYDKRFVYPTDSQLLRK